MSKSEIVRFLILRSIGNFLVLFAIFGVVATFGPVLYYEALFRTSQLRGVHYKVFGGILNPSQKAKTTVSFADILAGPKEQILLPKDTEFDILIPKLGVNEKIFPNTDPVDKNIFLPILRKGVAHAKGTFFPGHSGNIYIFAHSTDNFWDVGRYNAVFYLLKDLSPGDDIVIFFQNIRHNYIVEKSKIVESSDVSYITKARGEREQLILQTCWPPGTTWNRLLVLARPK